MSEIDELRKKRNEAICKEWVAEQTRMMTGEKPSIIMMGIGARHGLVLQQIVNILKAAGLYTGARAN